MAGFGDGWIRLEVRHELPGWALFWAELELSGRRRGGARPRCAPRSPRRARASHTPERLAEHPTAAAVRRLFRQAGCDPTRHRPSSEALLRRVLKGEELPAIHPLVDLNNCLSVELVVPACVTRGRLGHAAVRRCGPAGRGRRWRRCAGRSRCTASRCSPTRRVRSGPRSPTASASASGPGRGRAWLVAYLPAGVVEAACAPGALDRPARRRAGRRRACGGGDGGVG